MPTATKADLIKRLKELGCEFFFGIVDAKVMRNVDVNVLSAVLGGESRENAKVEV